LSPEQLKGNCDWERAWLRSWSDYWRNGSQRAGAIDVARQQIHHSFVPERRPAAVTSKGATPPSHSATPAGGRLRQ
jgi:hypothetical protein